MSGLDDNREELQIWLASAASASRVEIHTVTPLTGGAIQENWLIECNFSDGVMAGEQSFVVRCDAPSSIESSLSRVQEFKILRTALAAGVTVPEPLWLCGDANVIGRPFYIMRHVTGVALGAKVVKDVSLGGNRAALGSRLGLELAKIHSIKPARGELDFLEKPAEDPARHAIRGLRQYLDALDEARPVLEWGLRWAETNAPPDAEITFVHRDYRTGNYLIDKDGLTAILDWEFSGWGDPMSDIGWFCAKCWRFSRPDLEAGGIASRQTFYEGYEAGAGRSIDKVAVQFWEVMAHIRWAVIALQQTHRYLSGTENSLELALIGRLLPDLEQTILDMTSPSLWSQI